MPWYSPPRHWQRLKRWARGMRAESTLPEDRLWEALRAQRFHGVNFRRQHAIGPYIVDFYAPSARLVVEVDGPIHTGQRDRDSSRQSYLESGGFRVLRFANDQVLSQSDRVLAKIEHALKNPG